ncbi:sporulation membrane protein YtrI [Aquibacillus kalidii]|uniref:sporulation membrane protein YtrI n=1 Tax=Aquibacillus kalidii TaxID=2762597 RepID=UPI001644C792|nr:sporulation membrane protein YtrI [Aquibacillus kalidii]
MHIPPYYKKESWQRFFAGTFFGGIIAFIVFIYMYGQLYENWVEENINLRARVNELETNNKVLEENKKEADKQSQQQLSIDEITISIQNLKELKLEKDSLMKHQLEQAIKEEIIHIIGQDVQSVADNYQLLISTIENKTYKIDNLSEFTYSATVNRLFLTPSFVQIHVELSISK